ncbi:MAG: PilZ domain-containing protein [Thermoanaerobaculia bacterium]
MSGPDQHRSTARFVPERPFPAIFTILGVNTTVGIRDLSVNGAQIEHRQAIRPSTQGRLTILPDAIVPAIVIWSQLAQTNTYHSGLRIDEQLDVVAAAIRDLLSRGLVTKGTDTLRKKQEAALEREKARVRHLDLTPSQTGPTPEQIALIRHARERMLLHPEEAMKWYNRARVTASEDQVRMAGAGRVNREDVLAVWEYLERSIDLRFIVRALEH